MLQVGITRTGRNPARFAVTMEARILIPHHPWPLTANYFALAVAASTQDPPAEGGLVMRP